MTGCIHWVLDDDGVPSMEPDLLTWAHWFWAANRTIGYDRLRGMWVSTVFLGLDHNFSRSGSPVLFETMVFHRRAGGYMRRYCTRHEALVGHDATLRSLLEDLEARPRGYSQSHWRKLWRVRWVTA